MKALTIYQPWASLIMAGAKPYEFRGWSPRQRGGAYADLIGQRIVIHASARRIPVSEIRTIINDLERGGEASASTCLHADKALPLLIDAYDDLRTKQSDGHGNLPWSAGLGTAVLGEPRNGFDIAEEFGLPRVNDSDRDDHANFGWPMLEIEIWDEPIPMRGFQGFWNWPTPEGAAL